MKKLLVVLIIAGMITVANADLVFTVNGQPQGAVPDPVLLSPSETIELDLHLGDATSLLRYQLTYELSNEQAEFILDGVVFDWASIFPGKIDAYDQDGVISWVLITADNFFTPVTGPQDLMHGLLVHLLDNTDVVMTVTVSGSTIIDGETIPVGTEMHRLSVIAITTPEPCFFVGMVDSAGHTVTQAEVDLWVALGNPCCWCYDCHSKGDIDGNCTVNPDDVTEAAAGWIVYADGYCSDTDYNDSVNPDDITAMADGWINGCPGVCVGPPPEPDGCDPLANSW